MKVVEAAETVISNKVRAIFQHPSGYTTVLHKEDNRLYIYEQRYMSIVGTSKTAVSSAIELLTFSSNFNVFYAVCKEGNHQRQLRVFELNEMGELVSESMEFRKNITVVEPQYLCMATLQTKDQEGNDAELLICLDVNTYSCVTNIGRIIKQENLLLDGQNIKASKIKHIKETKFLICSENILLSANIDFQKCELREQLKLQDNIRDLVIDSSKLYIAAHTINHKMHIISSFGGRFRICFDFSTQSLNVSDACFFRPAVNTSATNKYRDRLYLVFQVLSNSPEKLQERRAKRNAEFINMTTNYSPNNLYFYQFRESLANRNQQFPILKAYHQFCLLAVGKVRSLFASSLVYNSVLALNHENKATSYNVFHLLSQSRLDKEWVYLSFKFQGCTQQSSILYEQREDEFESDLTAIKVRQISEEELNDWSNSSITANQVKNSKKIRIKCLDF